MANAEIISRHMVYFQGKQLNYFLFCLAGPRSATVEHLTRKSGVLGPGRVAQSVGHLTRKSGVLGSIPGLATYFRFSFCFFKKGSCQLLAKVCARSTG